MNSAFTVVEINGYRFALEIKRVFMDKVSHSFELLLDGGILIYSVGDFSGECLYFKIISGDTDFAKEFHSQLFEKTVLDVKS